MSVNLHLSEVSGLRLAACGRGRSNHRQGAGQLLDLVERIELFAERVGFSSFALEGKAINSRHFGALLADEKCFLLFLFDNRFAKEWLERATARDVEEASAPRFWLTLNAISGDKNVPLIQFECSTARPGSSGRLNQRLTRKTGEAAEPATSDTAFPRWLGPGIVRGVRR